MPRVRRSEGGLQLGETEAAIRRTLRRALEQGGYRWEAGHRTTVTLPESIFTAVEELNEKLDLKSQNKAILALLQLGRERLAQMALIHERVEDRLSAWEESESAATARAGQLADDGVDDAWEEALAAGRSASAR